MADRFTKLDVGRRQLEAGIRMFFDEIDSIATHTVLFAAAEVLRDLCRDRGLDAEYDKSVRRVVKEQHWKDYHEHVRKFALFFKHADRDPDRELDIPSDQINEMWFLIGCSRYRALTGRCTLPMDHGLEWLLWCNPDWMNGVPSEGAAKMQLAFARMNWRQQVAFGRYRLALIEERREEAERLANEFQARHPDAFNEISRMFAS